MYVGQRGESSRGAESVSLINESFGDISEVRYHVKDVILGDVVFCKRCLGFCGTGAHPCCMQEEDNPNRGKDSSALRVYESQSAFLRLVKVRWGGSGRIICEQIPSWTMIGKGSELRVVMVRHSESKAMWEEAIVRLGGWGPCKIGRGYENRG